MAQMPYCQNELSPWARIQYTNENPEANTFAQAGSESAVKGKSSGPNSGHGTSWKRRLTNAGSKTFRQTRHTSFGSSQHYKVDEGTAHSKPLDREASGAEVKRLLQLRRHKMKEAQRNGNGLEVHRLQNLGLFDDIDPPNYDEDFSEQSFRGVDSRSGLDVERHMAPPRLVTQGHTAELCWYMKSQEVNGIVIPTDFSSCTVHPAPPQYSTGSSLQETKLNPASLSSLRSSTTERTSTTTGVSTTEASTCVDSDVASLRSKTLSGPCSPSNRPSTTLALEDDDPFLYIGKCIHNHAKGTQISGLHRSITISRHENPPPCICPNHTCRSYLSGKSTQHCQICKLPKPQPEIEAAISRIEAYRNFPCAAFEGDTELNKAITSSERLQEDLMLIEMYNAEMETRCRDGVWWEGWIVVEQLKAMGIVGSEVKE